MYVADLNEQKTELLASIHELEDKLSRLREEFQEYQDIDEALGPE